MKGYRKKFNEHLFLIFLLGGLYGILDEGRLAFEKFVGNGIGMLMLAVAIGYLIHFVIGKISSNASESDIIDETEPNEIELKLINKLQPLKYAIYFAVFIILITIFNIAIRLF